VAEVPNGLACKNSCESRVALINQALDSNLQVRTVANNQIRSHAILVLVMGLIFIGCAVWAYSAEISGLAGFFGLFGFVFFVYGISRLRSRSQYPVQNSTAG